MREAAFFKIRAVGVLPEPCFDGKTRCGDGQGRQEEFGDFHYRTTSIELLNGGSERKAAVDHQVERKAALLDSAFRRTNQVTAGGAAGRHNDHDRSRRT